MKARIIYLTMLMMAMFTMLACSDEDFPEMSEKLKDNSVVIQSFSLGMDHNDSSTYQKVWEYGYRSDYDCFHSLHALENSLYASVLNELPKVDWEKQTLVIAKVYNSNIFNEDGCRVYSKSNKYTIEYKVSSSFGSMLCYRGTAIILNQPNVKKKDVNFKVSIAGLDY